MSLLKIKKVSEAGDRCWGVELLDDAGALLRSQEGVSKGEVTSMAQTLKSEGPGAPLLEDGKVQPGQAAWVIEKARGRWAVRFTPVTATPFDLLLKPEKDADENYLATCRARHPAENGLHLSAVGNFISITVLSAACTAQCLFCEHMGTGDGFPFPTVEADETNVELGNANDSSPSATCGAAR